MSEEPLDWYWECAVQRKAEIKAQRRANWRAFWFGLTHIFGGEIDWETQEQLFWDDVRRFGGRIP